MSYATPADLVERYEADLIAQRAVPEGIRVVGPLLVLTINGGDRSAYSTAEIEAADRGLARIVEVLLDADGLIDGYLSPLGLSLPLGTVPRIIKRIACEIAKFYLWGDQAGKDSTEERDYKASVKTLEGIRRGDVELGIQPQPGMTPDRVAPELVLGNERIFTRRKMRGS